MRRLSDEDLRILALESATVAGHTCKVIVLDREIDIDLLRASIRRRLDRAPGLLMQLHEIDGELCWAGLDELDLDLKAHVVTCEEAGVCDGAALREAVARIFEQRLDRSRPLWRIDVIPRLAGGGCALIWRIHHALADGSTAMRIASAALWDEQPQRAEGTPGRDRVLAPAPRHQPTGLLTAAREVPHPWHRSPLAGRIGARRSVAFASVELQGLHHAARITRGATLNDAVLTVVAGGLRRWLEAHHGHLGTVRVKVPVSLHDDLRAPGDEAAGPGNRDSFFCLDLPLGSRDPLDRLGKILGATRVRKRGHDAEKLDRLMRQLASTPLRHFAEEVLSHPRSFALNVSNVPGPRRPVRVLGVLVLALYSLAEIGEQHALRIAVVSLADSLNFGLAADPTLVPDVEVLASDIRAEAAALAGCLEPV